MDKSTTKKLNNARNRRIRGLIFTYHCNLDCTYCYIKEKSEKTMSFEIAKQAIKDVFEEAKNHQYEEVEIDFLGAEALTRFEEVKQVAEWIWDQAWPLPYVLFITTNGTMLDDQMKSWFTKNKHRFYLGLSYDGNATTQDINRTNSSAQIDLDFFAKTWPEQPTKMTISEETVHLLSDGIKYLHQKGFKVSANIAYEEKGWKKESIITYSKQLMNLVDYYSQNPDIRRASLLDIDFATLAYSEPMGKKYCGAGEGYDVVDIDGKRYPCHLFSPLVLEQDKLNKLKEIDFSSNKQFIDEKCKNCLLKRICPTCYGMNYKQNDHPAIRQEYICNLFIVQVLANCKLQARILQNKTQLSHKDYVIARMIKKILYQLNKVNRD